MGQGFVTLASVPAEVDATWWRRHAHLVRDLDEGGLLRFEPGSPRDTSASAPALPPPDEAEFAELAGQSRQVERLLRQGRGARAQGKHYPHVLVEGPAGSDKLTLARVIASTTGKPLTVLSAPRRADRVAWIRILTGVADFGVLFVDEVHKLRPALLGVLLEALSKGKLELTLRDERMERRITLHVPRFALVAATTDVSGICSSLYGHFGLREHLFPPAEATRDEVARPAPTAPEPAPGEPDARHPDDLSRVARRTPKAGRGDRHPGPGEPGYFALLDAPQEAWVLSGLARALGLWPAPPDSGPSARDRGAPNVRRAGPDESATP